MRVVIAEKVYNYVTDFPVGWNFIQNEAHKFPVKIGDETCYIKRYIEKPTQIPGWELILALQNKNEPNLPRVYDIIHLEEQGESVSYVFMEYIPPNSLDKLIEERSNVDLLRLTTHIFSAITTLQKYNYWFADFYEKKILLAPNGNFILTGLDTAQPDSQRPSFDMEGSKEYWGPVLSFYKNIVGYENIRIADIPGTSLNYLQHIFIVQRIKLSIVTNNVKEPTYSTTDLANIVHRIAPEFINVFSKIYNQKDNYPLTEQAQEIKHLIIEKLIHADVDAKVAEGYPGPIIIYYLSNKYIVEEGEAFTISWKVENADEVRLVTDDINPFKQIGFEGDCTIYGEFKKNLDKINFTLQATNNHGFVTQTIYLDKKEINNSAACPEIPPDGLELIECSVFAPGTINPGKAFLVQVITYEQAQRGQVLFLAKTFDEMSQPRGTKYLGASIQKGTELTFYLAMEGAKIDESSQKVLWHGTTENIQFVVRLPKECTMEDIAGTVYIAHSGIPFGQVKFILDVANGANTKSINTENQNAKTTWKRFKQAFICYASPDRSEVLKRVQMLPSVGIKFFQDLISLDPGDRWEKELYKSIDSCDVFFLFWSSAAKNSPWVMREVDYAIRKKGEKLLGTPEIIPIIIEGPPPVPPPPRLEHLHFNDTFAYFINPRDKLSPLLKLKALYNRMMNHFR